MESYIVRVYRREDGGRKRLVGTLEGADGVGQQRFHSVDELCALLLNGGRTATGSAVGTAIEQP